MLYIPNISQIICDIWDIITFFCKLLIVIYCNEIYSLFTSAITCLYYRFNECELSIFFYKIHKAYLEFKNKDGFCKVVSIEDILDKQASLNMALYVSNVDTSIKQISLDDALQNWKESSAQLKESMQELFQILN